VPRLKEMTPALRVGTSTTRHNLTIFPLFADGNLQVAGYLPVGVALRTGSARITEVSESGSIPTLAFENLANTPVLVIDGEELLGARQNRIANLTVLVPGNQSLPLPVSCVERGRWSYRSREFAESSDVMYREARARKARAVSSNLLAHGSRASDQGAVWADIDALSSKLGYNSPTAAMHDVSQSHRALIDGYVRGIEVADDQVGAIFAINGLAAGIELFDSSGTLRTYLPKVLRSYALDAIANQTSQPVTTKSDEADRFLDSILELDAQSFPAIGLGEDLRLNSPTISGGALAHDGRVIHLAAFRTELPRGNRRPGLSPDSTRPIDIRQGHIMIHDSSSRLAILDTGSPVSIGRGSEYRIAGQTWNPPAAMESVLDTVGSHIGCRIDWLLGHDFFAANRVIVDWPSRQAYVLGMNDSRADGNAVAMELVKGLPMVDAVTRRGPVRAIIDSGASLSYVPADVVSGLTPVGRQADFYPGFGEFETNVYRLRVEVGARLVDVTAGVLPPLLHTMFGPLLGNDGWIIGSDFFRERTIEIDYAGQRFVDLTHARSHLQ
jgi:hypothetical protein